MNAKKGTATKIIIGMLLVVIVCMGVYIVHLTGSNTEQAENPPAESSTPVATAPETKPDAAPEVPFIAPVVETTSSKPSVTPVEVKTGFTLESDIVYMIEDAPMWSDYSTSSEKIGTMARGECEARLGQGYGEAEGWSKFLPTAEIGVVYIENKYLSTEKPVSNGSTEIDIDSTVNNNVSQSESTSVETEQDQDQQVSNPNPQGDKSQEDFLKELAAQLGAQYTPDGEGESADGKLTEGLTSNTDHDYSGITIDGKPIVDTENNNANTNDDRNADQVNTGVLVPFEELQKMASGEGVEDEYADIRNDPNYAWRFDPTTEPPAELGKEMYGYDGGWIWDSMRDAWLYGGSNTDHDYSGITINP